MTWDALQREESCGGHFREEHQTPDGEAQRDDDHFAVVSAWEYRGEGQAPQRHREDFVFENVQLTQRSYNWRSPPNPNGDGGDRIGKITSPR